MREIQLLIILNLIQLIQSQTITQHTSSSSLNLRMKGPGRHLNLTKFWSHGGPVTVNSLKPTCYRKTSKSLFCEVQDLDLQIQFRFQNSLRRSSAITATAFVHSLALSGKKLNHNVNRPRLEACHAQLSEIDGNFNRPRELLISMTLENFRIPHGNCLRDTMII